jgi:hypothetical protein
MASQTPEEEQGERGFTVADKRLFNKTGERRPETEQPDVPPTRTPPPRQDAPRAEAPPPRPPADNVPPRDMPPADFSTFVAMLVNNVMMFLGQIPDPVSQQPRRDLAQAKHTIDILLMLRDKTQGNLTAEEDQLLQELLPQLQMAFVSASRQTG